MAKKTTLVSDLSGEEVAEGSAAKITVKVGDTLYVGDANASEVQELTDNLTAQKPRGRKAGGGKK